MGSSHFPYRALLRAKALRLAAEIEDSGDLEGEMKRGSCFPSVARVGAKHGNFFSQNSVSGARSLHQTVVELRAFPVTIQHGEPG